MKKLIPFLLVLLCSCSGLTAATDPAASSSAARAEESPEVCVVSGETLGEMGPPIEYVYKEAGKPDRVVRFCCKNCLRKFIKDPAKYLAILDKPVAAKKP